MSLTVEDGTGLATADTYLSRADAETYHDERGNTAWASLTDAEKDAALRYGTTTLDGLYSWTGTLISTTQALGWPRSGASDHDGRYIASDAVPTCIQHATCELALLHASSALNAHYERGGAIRRERVGPLETEYAPGASVEPALPVLDHIVGGLGTRRSWTAREVERA